MQASHSQIPVYTRGMSGKALVMPVIAGMANTTPVTFRLP